MNETWLPVPGYEGRYSVSDRGDVMSMGWNGTDLLKILKPARGSHGYLQVNLWRDNKAKSHLIHSVVAAAFLGPRPKGLHINHKSGIKTDNRADNLEYVTRTQNAQHASAMGLTPRGERQGSSKLTAEKVVEIKLKLDNGWSYAQLARDYGVGGNCIQRIHRGTTWRHIRVDTLQ